MGPIVPHVGVKFSSGSKNEHTIEGHGNFVYEKDFNAASRFAHNMTTKENEAQGALVWKN